MRQIIPFVKDVVFKTNIASITSISLECEEHVSEGEINGNFIVFGDYKIHNDTTEKELFKYKLPFTAIIPDNIILETVSLDIKDFTYDIIENNAIRVKIDFLIEGEENKDEKIEKEREESTMIDKKIKDDTSYYLDQKLDEFLNRNIVSKKEDILEKSECEDINITNSDNVIFDIDMDKGLENDSFELNKEISNRNEEEQVMEDNNIKEKHEDNKEVVEEEYITYHIHIVKENETIEEILKIYETDLDNIRMYNDITNINIGDKIIIPEYLDE